MSEKELKQLENTLWESAEKMIEKIIKLKDKYITMCRESYMPDEMKSALETLIEQRIAILTN